MTRYMHLLTDYAFKRIFGTEQNKKLLIAFLNAVINEDDPIVDVNFLDKESIPNTSDNKRIVFDIYCVTQHDRHIIVEMQRRKHPTFAERTLTYCCHALMKQINRGDKSYDLKPVYGIFLMDFHLCNEKSPKLLKKVALCDCESHEVFMNKLRMYYLDLKMMNRKSIGECKTDVEKWLFLLKNMENMESKPYSDPIFDDLFEAADTQMMAAEDVVAYSESRQKMIDDYEAMMFYGQEQLEVGKAQGIALGKDRGKAQTTSQFVNNMRMQGWADEDISKALGIPLEQVNKIIK